MLKTPSSPPAGGRAVNTAQPRPLPPAVVLSCEGHCEPALGVVRALGERGVPVIVLSETRNAAAALSRYCIEHRVAAQLGGDSLALRAALEALADRHGGPLPVFPTVDPDLDTLLRLAPALDARLAPVVGAPELMLRLMDKAAFQAIAEAHGLPVPRTWSPGNQAALADAAREAHYPVIVKPAFPYHWHGALAQAFSGKKAVLLEDAEALRSFGAPLGERDLGVLVQEYVPGGDDHHVDVHAYIDRRGRLRATFAGCKLRIYPAHAGSGCYVEALDLPALEHATAQMLQRIGFTGLANVNYKRHAVTGEYALLEINPRISQWGIFTTRAGVNLPWLAYCDRIGIEPGALPPRRVGLRYVDSTRDLKAFHQYRAAGELTLAAYLRSLLRWRLVHQSLDWRDPLPGLSLLWRHARAVLGHRH